MASLSLPTPADPTADPAQTVLLIAGFGDPVAEDYADFVRRAGQPVVDGEDKSSFLSTSAVVVFLPRRLTNANRAAMDELLARSAERRAESLTLVSSVRVHLGDPEAAAVEAYAFDRARGLRSRTVIVRAGHILAPHSRLTARLRRFAGCFPLVPQRLRTCFLKGDELFAMIEAVRQKPRTRRLYTLLGPNRPWRELLAEHHSRGFFSGCLTVVCAILSLLLLGQVAAFLFGLLARRRPALSAWNFDTLRPGSLRELVALANPYNRRYVQVVGYNNGVTHFGHRYPGRTIVSTVCCNRVSRTPPPNPLPEAGRGSEHPLIRADCGVTVRKALDFLAGSEQELYVIPNYSYVCLGTAFFVPIHGSASDFSTLADTITEAVLYDPATDRVTRTARDEPLFRENVYNSKSDVVVLQLFVRVKPKSHYYLCQQELESASADELLQALRDPEATNVEVRKSRAGDSKVRLLRFYNNPGNTQSPVQELPRDRLGRLWDRLEENAVTSFLMHALTRHLAFHVELFFTDEEFRTFWETNRSLPLRKIQLRYIHRDGFPSSPFRDHDCVSADLFMFRWRRRQFEAYLKQTFAVVRSNPGKHST